jgi:hypothetical protein
VLETHADLVKNNNVPIGLVGGSSVVSEIGAPNGTIA